VVHIARRTQAQITLSRRIGGHTVGNITVHIGGYTRPGANRR
jgi:hypothetical protein